MPFTKGLKVFLIRFDHDSILNYNLLEASVKKSRTNKEVYVRAAAVELPWCQYVIIDIQRFHKKGGA